MHIMEGQPSPSTNFPPGSGARRTAEKVVQIQRGLPYIGKDGLPNDELFYALYTASESYSLNEYERQLQAGPKAAVAPHSDKAAAGEKTGAKKNELVVVGADKGASAAASQTASKPSAGKADQAGSMGKAGDGRPAGAPGADDNKAGLSTPADKEGAKKQAAERAEDIGERKADKFPERAAVYKSHDQYAGALATRRSGGIDYLVTGTRRSRLLGSILSFIDFWRARREKKTSDQARQEYGQAWRAYGEYISNLPYRDEVKERGKARLATVFGRMAGDFEQEVFEAQVLQAGAHLDEAGQMAMPDTRNVRFSEKWQRSGRLYKVARVAGPAAVVGAGVGIGVAIIGWPLWATAGVGALTFAGGRAYGGHLARRVNRHRAATQTGYARLVQGTDQRIEDIKGYLVGLSTDERSDPTKITDKYEEKTNLEAENEWRTHDAKLVGGVAAAIGYIAGNVGVHAVEVVRSTPPGHGGATPNHSSTPQYPSQNHGLGSNGSHPGSSGGSNGNSGSGSGPNPNTGGNSPNTPGTTPNAPPIPANIGHIYPWDAAAQYNIAHQLPTSPSAIWDTLDHAAALYNQTHPGAHYHYVLHGTKYWLQNGFQTPTWALNADFNKFLWFISTPAHMAAAT